MPELAQFGVALVQAENSSPLTLDGTNSWVVGSHPAYVVDPGPAQAEHLDALAAEVKARGGLGGVALTHDHTDHREGVHGLLERCGSAPVAGAGEVEHQLRDGQKFGPLSTLATPGHSPEHLAFLTGLACFTGDAVLGAGSVFVAAEPGMLRGYLCALQRMRGLGLRVLCPGHGPVVWDPDAKLDEYLAHRRDRERRLQAALQRGLRTHDELLDAAWADVAPELRRAAQLTLIAHLHKLREEGQLPEDLQTPG